MPDFADRGLPQPYLPPLEVNERGSGSAYYHPRTMLSYWCNTDLLSRLT